MASDRTRNGEAKVWLLDELKRQLPDMLSAMALANALAPHLQKLLDARRDRCFKDMYRFIENCRKDSTPDVPAEALPNLWCAVCGRTTKHVQDTTDLAWWQCDVCSNKQRIGHTEKGYVTAAEAQERASDERERCGSNYSNQRVGIASTFTIWRRN